MRSSLVEIAGRKLDDKYEVIVWALTASASLIVLEPVDFESGGDLRASIKEYVAWLFHGVLGYQLDIMAAHARSSEKKKLVSSLNRGLLSNRNKTSAEPQWFGETKRKNQNTKETSSMKQKHKLIGLDVHKDQNQDEKAP